MERPYDQSRLVSVYMDRYRGTDSSRNLFAIYDDEPEGPVWSIEPFARIDRNIIESILPVDIATALTKVFKISDEKILAGGTLSKQTLNFSLVRVGEQILWSLVVGAFGRYQPHAEYLRNFDNAQICVESEHTAIGTVTELIRKNRESIAHELLKY